MGFQNLAYLDDDLGFEIQYKHALKASLTVKEELLAAGYITHRMKSQWIPVRQLGWMVVGQIRAEDRKVVKAERTLKCVRVKKVLTAR